MPRPWRCRRPCRASGRCSRAGRSSNRPGTAPRTRVLATLRSNAYLSAHWSGTAAQVNADDQHRAPVPGGRQRRAVPRRRDPHRRAAALRRGARCCPRRSELIGRPATEQLLRDVQDRILSLGPVRERDHRRRRQRQRPGSRAGAAGTARTAAAAGHGRCRLCRRHRAAAVAGACAPAHLRHALGRAQQAADRPEPELLDRRPDLAPAGRRLPQPARRAGREARSATTRRATPGTPAPAAPATRCASGACTTANTRAPGSRPRPASTTARRCPATTTGLWRDVDDLRTPTRGTVWSLQGGLGYARGTVTPIDGGAGDRRHRPLRAPVRPGAGLPAAGQLVLRQRPARAGTGVRAARR